MADTLAFALCFKWQPEVITVREELPVPAPEPVAEPVPETNLQEQPLAPDPMLISNLDDLRNNVEVILEEMGEAGEALQAMKDIQAGAVARMEVVQGITDRLQVQRELTHQLYTDLSPND